MRRTIVYILGGLFLCVLPSVAQEITGTIVGSVQDAQGKAVPNATVTFLNTDKNVVVRTLTTNDQGEYVATLLPIGHYSLTAEAPGFKKATEAGIILNVNDKLTFNLKLEIGSVSESVIVQAEALQVDSQTPTAAGLISGAQIRELSINTRNYEQLVSLMPGVSIQLRSDQLYVGATSPSGLSNQINFSINGNRPTQNNWSIDGADNVDRGANLTLLTYPSVDSIEEFKVLRGQYNAEFGRSSSGQINVVTRSGGSSFHGSLYEFFRNDVLAANSFINNRSSIARPALRYNDFGGTFSGPIYIPGVYNKEKNKTFFFFSEEVRRVVTNTTFVGTVPNSAERAGNFATLVCTAHNPTTGRCVPGTGTMRITNINPAAAAYVKDIFSRFPEPDATDTLTFTGRNVFNLRQEILKVDHIFGPRLSVMGRFGNDNIPTQEPGGLFTGSALPGVASTQTNSPGRTFSVRATMTLSSTLLNELGYNYSKGSVVSDPTGLGSASSATDVISAISLQFRPTVTRVPDLNFGDGTPIVGFGPYRDFNRNHNWFDNVTKSVGRHTFKTGAGFHWYQKSENNGGTNGAFNQGQFSFNDTDPTGKGTFQQEFASFLVGEVQGFAQASVDFRAEIRQNQFEVYGQDEWRARPNLTLTVGVRYSYSAQPTDANGRATNFDPHLFDPTKAFKIDPATGNRIPGTGDPLNGIIIGGSNSPFGKAVGNTDPYNFAPRFGFAWDPFKTGKTSIRGGYGIFYDSPAVGFMENQLFGNPPFVNNISISNTRLDNPGAVPPDVILAPPAIGAFAVDWHQPYTQEWSLDVQRELMRNLVLDIGYYGAKGTHLIGDVDFNEPRPGAAQAAGLVKPPIGDSQTPLLNGARPFLGYDAINTFTPAFDSDYHSLQASLQKRLSGNSLIAVNYTYSNSGTNAESDFRVPQNTYDFRAERGPTQFDRRHIFNANFVYELPWLRNQEGFAGHVFGGWEFSGIVTYYTGLPLTATGGRRIDPAGLGLLDPASNAGRRPNQIGNPNDGAPHTFDQWFNTSVYVNPTNSQTTPGNSARGAIRGPGLQRWDLSFFKNTKIREGMRLQFRAEAFNVFNHTNFDTLRTTRQSPTFGRVLSTRDPRIMQLALKFSF